MTYQNDRRPDEPPHRVVLPRRSLQLQTGFVRFNFRHSISNADLGGPRRVSITFRKMRSVTLGSKKRTVEYKGPDCAPPAVDFRVRA